MLKINNSIPSLGRVGDASWGKLNCSIGLFLSNHTINYVTNLLLKYPHVLESNIKELLQLNIMFFTSQPKLHLAK